MILNKKYFKDSIYIYHIQRYKKYNYDMNWEMKNGIFIKIKDMKDSHIKNCINMLNRKKENATRIAWIDIFEDVKLKRRNLKINNIINEIHRKNEN